MRIARGLAVGGVLGAMLAGAGCSSAPVDAPAMTETEALALPPIWIKCPNECACSFCLDQPPEPTTGWPGDLIATLKNTKANTTNLFLSSGLTGALAIQRGASGSSGVRSAKALAGGVAPSLHFLGVNGGSGTSAQLFDEDGTYIADGTEFNVLVTSDSLKPVVQTASTPYRIQFADLTDPSSHLFVGYQGNPSVSVNYPVAVAYLGGNWAIVMADKSPIPTGAAFYVVVGEQMAKWSPNVSLTVTATASNLVGGAVVIDNKTANNPDMALFVTPVVQAGLAPTTPLAVQYDGSSGHWLITSTTPLVAGMTFNVLVMAPRTCIDGVKDGAETDVDCGGGTCAPCGDGKACNTSADCVMYDDCFNMPGGGHACGPT
jgi:hypothetical protein